MKKSISIILSLALLFTSVFTVATPVFANENEAPKTYKVVNNYDEENVTYTNDIGSYTDITTALNKRDDYGINTVRTVNGVTETSPIVMNSAVIDKTTDANGNETNAVKLGYAPNNYQVAVFDNTKPRRVNTVKIYDSNKADLGLFIPEPYTTYTISFDYKVEEKDSAADKYWNFRLMYANDATGTDFNYNNDGTDSAIKTKNNIIDNIVTINSNTAEDEWLNTGNITFTTGSTVAPLYIAVVSINVAWWYAPIVSVDNIEINYVSSIDTKRRSTSSFMTFDESKAVYTNHGTFVWNNTDNALGCYTERTVNENTDIIASNNTRIEKVIVGDTETYAAHFGQTRNHGDCIELAGYTRKVNTLKLYDSNTEDLQYFVPEENTTYTISFDYVAPLVGTATDKKWNFRLMYANDIAGMDFDYDSDGVGNSFAKEKVIIDSMLKITNTTDTSTSEWKNTGELTFTTGDYVAPLYLAVITETTWWFNAEVWVDNITIEKKVVEVNYSTNSTMTFDDENSTYTNHGTFAQNANDAANVYTVRTVDGVDTTVTANNTHISGVVGADNTESKAVRFGKTKNQKAGQYIGTAMDTLRMPNILKLYDSNSDGLSYFIPEPNTTYTIKFDYMASSVGADIDKKWEFRLMYANDVIGNDFNYDANGTLTSTANVAVDSLLSVDKNTVTNTWFETDTIIFTTGDYVAPLYITVVTNPTWWYKAEVWVDNIVINKAEAITETYDAGDVNGDSAVNVLDFIWIKKIISKSAVNDKVLLADINKDNILNVLDIVALKKIILLG